MRKGTNVPRKEWGRHRRLLQNPDVRRRYDNLARGSPVTADVRLRRPGVYCETAGTTPEEFAGAGARDVRAVDDLLMDRVSFLESSGDEAVAVDFCQQNHKQGNAIGFEVSRQTMILKLFANPFSVVCCKNYQFIL